MANKEILAYLDHNILDRMTKGDPDDIRNILETSAITPVYSDETLKEIERSVGYENNFLTLLNEISAKKIVPLLEGSKLTGKAELLSSDSFEAYEQYMANSNPSENSNFGLSEMVQKLYGGRNNETYEGILKSGAEELSPLFRELEQNIDEIPLPEGYSKEQFREMLSAMPKLLEKSYEEIYQSMDNEAGESPVKDLENVLGIGPKQLNNIDGPGVLKKIWALLEKPLEGKNQEFDVFFGIIPNPAESDSDREKTIQEKVNAIYHQLNYIGYHRDTKMHKERRFKASMSDMTHAGLASFCHLIFCRDKGLVMKTAAAYEYLGMSTRILYYKS